LTVVQSLKDLALTGANVITVLHQPKYEVFRLFDQVLLLGKGGMVAYFGPTSRMSEYFEKLGFPCPLNVNPADFYMDVVSGIMPHSSKVDFDIDDLFEAWMCAVENPDAVSPEEAMTWMKSIKAQRIAEATEKKKHHRAHCTESSQESHRIFRDYGVIFMKVLSLATVHDQLLRLSSRPCFCSSEQQYSDCELLFPPS
jgi:ABC-type multidrug transport system ATPase subunit